MDNVTRARDSLRRVLEQIHWADAPGQSEGGYRVDLGEPHRPVSDVVLGIEGETRTFLLLANFSPRVAPAMREAVSRYIQRANWDLMAGNFEMDGDSGELRYRLGMPFGAGELDEATIRGAILDGMQCIEAHAGALSAALMDRGLQ